MRSFIILSCLAIISGCESLTEDFTINGVEVSREDFEEQTGTGDLPAINEDPVADTVVTRLNDIDASGIASRSNTAFPAIEAATGEANFTGVLDIETRGVPGREFNVLSETTIVADFDAATLSTALGETTILTSDNETLGSPTTSTLAVTNGLIGVDRPNSVNFDVNGSVSTENVSITVQSNLEGSFKGTPILGLIANDNAAIVIVNGAASPNASVTIEALSD